MSDIDDKTVLKLRNIVNEGRPRTITIKGKKYYISKDKIKYAKQMENEKEGGFLISIPLLLAGIGAAAGVAGAGASIAKAVQDKKAHDTALAEQKRHNKNLEAAARGQGLAEIGKKIDEGINTTKQAIKDFVSKVPNIPEEGKNILKKTLYHLADTVDVRKEGNGLYLSPFPEH